MSSPSLRNKILAAPFLKKGSENIFLRLSEFLKAGHPDGVDGFGDSGFWCSDGVKEENTCDCDVVQRQVLPGSLKWMSDL
jgi:hypothetical protein